ncbi:response regulator [Amaricoccus macauensis]|uniref:response regulator n=1 Tax=Amaricoccus macauensis TaxID=57001 RepID=UPI003C7D93F3
MKRWLILIAFLLVLGFGAFWTMFLDLRREESLLFTENAALYEDMIAFERTTGYGGFIHNFKNAVLRPDEPVYLASAQDHLTEALVVLDRIEGRMAAAGAEIDLGPVRSALEQYREMVAVLERTAPLSLPARELDDLVRTPDDLAVVALVSLVAQAREDITVRIAAVELRLFRLSIVTAAFNALLLGAGIATFMVLRRREQASLDSVELVNARLQMVLETSTNGVVAVDVREQVVLANDVARQMLGLPAGIPPFPWKSDGVFLNAEDLNPLDDKAHPVLRALAGEAFRGEIVAIKVPLQAGTRYLRVSARHVEPGSQALYPDVEIRLVLIFEDVTEQEVNRQKFERAGRLDALGQLTGGIAHDFNNILASIMYAIELSLSDPLPDKARDWLTRARRSVGRGSDLARRLLAFARQQPGIAQSRPVREVLSEIESLARPAIEATIEIEIECPEEELMIFCDPGQLENSLLNLILNSRDAIRQSGMGNRIKVAARAIDRPLIADPGITPGPDGAIEPSTTPMRTQFQKSQRFIEISVTDNGPGMSSEVKRRAIDPFFTTKGQNMGSGLGLSIVYGFVQQSGGEMRVYSEPKLGTTVRMLIPRGADLGAAGEVQTRLPTPLGQAERLLLVEDDEGLLRMLEDVVTSLGYRYISASSGAEALRVIDDGAEFDLLLTDIVMPGSLDGYELARELRDRQPDVPVVYMSGYAGLEGNNVGSVAGPWIQKPCTAGDLARVLRSSLNSS